MPINLPSTFFFRAIRLVCVSRILKQQQEKEGIDSSSALIERKERRNHRIDKRPRALNVVNTPLFSNLQAGGEKKKRKTSARFSVRRGNKQYEREREGEGEKTKKIRKRKEKEKRFFYSFIIIQTRRTLTTQQRSCRTLRPRSFLLLLLLLRPDIQNSLPSVSFILRFLTYLRIQRSKEKKIRFSGSYLRLFFFSFYSLLSLHCG